MSIMGPLIINLLFALLAIMLLFGQSFFRCHEFDGSTVDLRRWWELADNFEGAVTTIVIMYQILNAAAAFNLGTKYRQGGLQNKIFLTAYGIVFATISFLLLSDPNSLGCQFRINCGTAPALENLGYAIPFNAPTVYHAESGHNVLPLYFRVILFGLMLLNLIAVMGWELVAILGPARASLKQLQQRQPLRL